jgi:hypothetical protein
MEGITDNEFLEILFVWAWSTIREVPEKPWAILKKTRRVGESSSGSSTGIMHAKSGPPNSGRPRQSAE